MPNWLLPENIADVLPSEARKIEELRRLMLDNFRLYGYELVMPPLLEYTESLLAGAGQDTEAKTFKVVDPQSGRLPGYVLHGNPMNDDYHPGGQQRNHLCLYED